MCEYEGVVGTYYNYNFCDTDWDLALMHYFGFPSKLAHFSSSPEHPKHPDLNGVRAGSRRTATVDRLGQRLITARATLEEKVELADTPLSKVLSSYGVRHIPNMDHAADGRPLAFDLVKEEGFDHSFGDLWHGTGELDLPRGRERGDAPALPGGDPRRLSPPVRLQDGRRAGAPQLPRRLRRQGTHSSDFCLPKSESGETQRAQLSLVEHKSDIYGVRVLGKQREAIAMTVREGWVGRFFEDFEVG